MKAKAHDSRGRLARETAETTSKLEERHDRFRVEACEVWNDAEAGIPVGRADEVAKVDY